MSFKVKTFSALAAIAALSLASCSSEEPLGNDNNSQEREGIGYMSFTIANPADGTRAAGDETADSGEVFNNGDAQEYAICPNNDANAAFFFDGSGNFWGMSNLQAVNNTGDGHESHNKYAEKYYTYMTRWRNDDSSKKPSQVIIVLNANPSDLNAIAESNPTVDNFFEYEAAFSGKAYTYGIYNYADKQYFTMSNSMFDANTATSIEDVQVCETAEQALQNPVTVYVERELAKFELGLGKNGASIATGDFVFYPFATGDTNVEDMATINYVASYDGKDADLDYPKYTPSEWAAYITSWGINGLEKQQSILKNINPSATYFANWQAPTYHRSFWGESELYTTTDGFTTQYRDASYDPEAEKYQDTYFGNITYDPTKETEQLNALHYISYNDIQTRATYKYTGERTFNTEDGLKGYGPYRYASHYLLGAQLLIKDVDYDALNGTKEGNVLQNARDKYYAYNFYFAGEDAKNDYIRYAYHRMAAKFADGREHSLILKGTTLAPISTTSTGTLYKDADGTELAVSEAADFFTTQSAQVIHGDGKVTLKASQPIYYKNGEGKFVAFTDDQLTALIYSYVEAARHFNKGAMYYAIPVQHNQGKTYVTDRIKVDKDRTEPYAVGDFGVVRNHWYRLKVNTIGSIGIPVDNPDQPIIPDPENDYYIAIEIVVLPWHIIDNGEVDL